MTGGVPYGRPLAERAEDRDGLKLDHLPLRIGPLFTPFPAGLALDVKLQGDVIQQATVENFVDPAPHVDSIFERAHGTQVAIRDLEVARARSHLRWLSDAIAVVGPRSLSERVLRLAERSAPGDADAVRALERRLRRRGFFGWSTRGVGIIRSQALEAIGGPVARASGVAVDARADDGAYQRLGFEPVVLEAGDVAARSLQRVREAAQALDLAARAGDARAEGRGATETPRGSLGDGGTPSLSIAGLIPSLLEGMEWGDAVATIVSLDLDMCELRVAHQEAAS